MKRGGKGGSAEAWRSYILMVLLVLLLSVILTVITSSLLGLTTGYQQVIVAYVYTGLLMLGILLYITLVLLKRQRRQIRRLEISETRLKAKAGQTIDLITQIDNLQIELEQSNKRHRANEKHLKSLDSTKDDFISMASHQLRTPLTSIKGYLSMVLDGDTGKINDLQRKMLGQAFVSSQRMVYIIADLLNVSRLQTGKFFIDRSPVNLAQVLEEEVVQLRETAEVKMIKLTFEPPEFSPPLMLDETKIRQVVMNFIDNAIYYTPEKGQIDIELKVTKKMVELRIKDSGMGVPKKDQPHLFTKFYRASNARKARPDGTGLGLFMAKKVIIAQGGSILFKSSEGKGSTFGFSFPLVRE